MNEVVAAFPAKYAVEAQLFSSKSKDSPQLHGFAVQRGAGGEGVDIISTNLHIMGIFHACGGRVVESIGEEPILVKLDKATLKACTGEDHWLVLDSKGHATVVKDLSGVEAGRVPGHPLFVALEADVVYQGMFPDWRAVLPRDDVMSHDEGVWYNANYLVAFSKISPNKLKAIRVCGRRKGPAWVQVADRPDFVGCIMAIDEAVVVNRPDWLGEDER